MTASIVRAAIHPAIGVARVGNSPDAFILAPQVPDPAPREANASHDAGGRLKRQAVEFRIYGYDAGGLVVAELTADNAEIAWTVRVANAKAAWYKFRHAMDVSSLSETVVERRNPAITDAAARRQLFIDPGPRSISGRGEGGAPAHRFDTGTFKGSPVYLGEMRTTAQGRLLFLPGHGVSASPGDAPPLVESDEDAFGNAADWHDDVADGPVDATVTLDGRAIPVTGAWVVSAPPSYAPDLKSWRTLHDVLVDLYVANGWLPRPERVSFAEHVLPMLDRLSGLQWVNRSFASIFGKGAPFDFTDPVLIDRIARRHGAADVYRPLRESIVSMFRNVEAGPSGEAIMPADPGAWPWLYGDSFGTTPDGSDPNQYLFLEGERLRQLSAWADGDFVPDWPALARPTAIDAYPLAGQPAALDRGALDFCVADAFHPGIELTWPMRRLSIYAEPFRIRRATGDEPDYGPTLDVPTVLGAQGPLHGQFAGSLSRWMLLPWQIDTGGCLSGYDTGLRSDAPSFWPARVPNFVLSHDNYRRATDPTVPEVERVVAFVERRSWFDRLGPGAGDWGKRLIHEFGSMGVIEAYAGLVGDARIPAVIYAETLPPGAAPAAPLAGAPGPVSAADAHAQAAGFASEADRTAMRRLRFGR